MLRPYMIFDGVYVCCSYLEAGGGKVAAEILQMVLLSRRSV
jgi:hypothetical protein